MFTQQLPAGVFTLQREFMKAMETNRDFYWWAKTLVVEETKELKAEYEKPILDNVEDIFKELADVIYVVAGFYNCLPVYAPEIVSDKMNQEIQNIMDDAADIVSKVSTKLQIPLPLIVAAFEEVHKSNMSKLDDNGKPIRREDGKVLKGPNYRKPNLKPIVEAWKKFQIEKGQTENAQVVDG